LASSILDNAGSDRNADIKGFVICALGDAGEQAGASRTKQLDFVGE
jgi:hypothetical protein